MAKEKVLPWLLQKILIPENEIMDKPGYIVTKLTDAKRTTYLREVCLFEDILVTLEKEIMRKYGVRGRCALYKAGKMFGYQYSEFSSFERYNSDNRKNFEKFFKFFMDYLRALWFGEYKYRIDCDKKLFTAEFQKHLVCNKNGFGHVLTEGCYAGFWAYLMGDSRLEGKQIKCQGRGDRKCVVLFGPTDLVGLKYIALETDQLVLTKDYNAINAIRATKYSHSSFIAMLNNKLFTYNNGVAEYDRNRIFIIGSNLIYHVEHELEKINSSNSILFNVCFDVGKKYAKRGDERFIIEFMASCGWGDPTIIKDEKGKWIILNEIYPWFKTNFEHKFVMYRGILSGMMTECFGRNIKFQKYSGLVGDSFTVTVRE